MGEREQIKQIIDRLPEYKLSSILLFLQGIAFDDELEDDYFCQRLYESYENDPDPHKGDFVTLEELAAEEGIDLT